MPSVQRNNSAEDCSFRSVSAPSSASKYGPGRPEPGADATGLKRDREPCCFCLSPSAILQNEFFNKLAAQVATSAYYEFEVEVFTPDRARSMSRLAGTPSFP